MPNTRRMRRNNRSARTRGRRNASPMVLLNGVDRPFTVTGKVLLNFSLSGTTQQVLLSPIALDANRLGYLQRAYQEYKFSKLVIRMHQDQNPTQWVVAYFKNQTDSIPAVLSSAYQAAASRFLSITDTVPQTLVVQPSVLMGGVRTWYLASTTTGTALDQNQGYISITNGNAAASRIWLEIGYEVSFRGPTSGVID